MLEPSTAVQFVKGIGPRLAEVLAAKGLNTVDDLLHYLPFRYEDRLNPALGGRTPRWRDGDGHRRSAQLGIVSHAPHADLPTDRGPGPHPAEMYLVQRRPICRAVFRPGQMVALYGKVEEDRDGQSADCAAASWRFSATLTKKAAPTTPKRKPPPRSKSDASFQSTNRPAREAHAALVSAHYPLGAREPESRSARSHPGRGARAS